tara:strand:+ start:159 stop:1310 length:1152 start_codon:yes stop_codon:yes gene_type:complete
MYDFVIHGGGFKAFYWALKLRKKFPQKKIAIKSQGSIGGIYNSIKKNNLYLDLGCHLFDYTDKRFINLFNIDLKKVIPVKLKYASINHSTKTENYSIFDFRTCNSFYKTLKENFLKKNRKKIIEKNLLDYFLNRHGSLATQVINTFSVKITGKTLDLIDKKSHEFFLMKRLLIANNLESLSLKKRGYNELVAAQSKSVHDYSKGFINFTFPNGNKGFLDHVIKLLGNKKIDIIQSEYKTRKNLFTNIVKNKKLESLAIKVPLHVCYFLSKNFPYTYIHDFSYNPIFRVSSPGHYSKQFLKKRGYLCVEIPDPNNLFDKKTIVKLAQEYLKKYCSTSFFHYVFVKQSYPSLFLKSEKNIIGTNLNPYLYSKQSIMDEIDNFSYD